MYHVFAPAYAARTSGFIKKSMSGKLKCGLCGKMGEEVPLVELKYHRIMEAKYRSTPEHVMIVSKSHIQGLHEMGKMDEAVELFSVIRTMLERRPHLMAFSHYGIAAGQTIPHMHMHVMSSSIENITTKRKISDSAYFVDPLSESILYNADYTVGNRRRTWIESKIDLSSYINIMQAFGKIVVKQAAFLSAFESMKNEIGSMLLPKHMHDGAARRAQTIRLLGERTMDGCGVVWNIIHRDGAFYLQITPRATRIDPSDYTITSGAPELFFNMRFFKTGISGAETERWDKITADFHREIKGLPFASAKLMV